MNTKTKWYVFCVLEGLLTSVLLTLSTMRHSILYAVIIFLLISAIPYVRKKMLPMLSLHEQMLWSAVPFSLFLFLAYGIFRYVPMLLGAIAGLVMGFLEWKYSFFSKRYD